MGHGMVKIREGRDTARDAGRDGTGRDGTGRDGMGQANIIFFPIIFSYRTSFPVIELLFLF